MLEKNNIQLHFKSSDLIISLNNIEKFKSKLLINKKIKKDLLSENTWLLSMWVILLFWDNIDSSDIVLIKRDDKAKFDPNCLTMPAGRLDTLLSIWCYKELSEELISWNDKCYFSFFSEFFNDKKMRNSLIKIQENRIHKLKLPKKQIKEVVCKSIDLKIFYKVDMYYDWKMIDSVDNIFVFIDETNKTLEFRKVLLSPKQNISNFFDWDWYKREVLLVNLKNLKKWKLIWKHAMYPDYDLQNITLNGFKYSLSNTLKAFLQLF